MCKKNIQEKEEEKHVHKYTIRSMKKKIFSMKICRTHKHTPSNIFFVFLTTVWIDQ